jgi:hypothetical protein
MDMPGNPVLFFFFKKKAGLTGAREKNCAA